MEEILASIRRIISDEDGAAAADDDTLAGGGGEAMNQEDLDALFDAPLDASEDDEEPEAAFDEAEPEEDAGPRIVEGIGPEDSDVSFAEQADDEEDDGPPLELGPEHEIAAQPEEDEPAPPERPAKPTQSAGPAREREPIADPIMSPATDALVSSAFNNLAHTILSKNSRTLEDLVQEMLRPMLKSWLDDNLPVIVERMVRQEIERVTRGGGGYK